VEEGIPQLARFLFLSQAWARVVPEDDASWITSRVADSLSAPGAPYAAVGHALNALLSRGATEKELTDLVRGMQAVLLFQLCYLLEDPDLPREVEDVRWGLFVLDGGGVPVEPLAGLHESVLETDPTDREMRPRRSDVP
jgi:hypothetical protein